MAEVDFALKDKLRQAVFDPGSVVGRRLGPSWGQGQPGYSEQQETVWDWVARAVYATIRPEPLPHGDIPQVLVINGDRADLVGTAGELLSLLDYERLLVLQERIEDAVEEMALLPLTAPQEGVRRSRKSK